MEDQDTLPSVMKRSRSLQPFRGTKLLHTMKRLSWDLDTNALDLHGIVESLRSSVATQISSHELQNFVASTLASFSGRHPDYGRLAARMLIANIHKTVPKSFTDWVFSMAPQFDLHPDLLQVAAVHGPDLDNALVHHRDFDLELGSVKTLMRCYLKRIDAHIRDRPQFLYMRVAIATHQSDLPAILKTYDALSRQLYTNATPVLYNAGTSKRNFASCFLYQPDTSSLKSLLTSPQSLDALWMAEGGVGMSLGLVPEPNPGVMALMRIYDSHANVVANSGARRPSAATVYLPIWHQDVRQFIQCRTTRAGSLGRISHLFPALWIPDLYMRRLEAHLLWSLFDPSDAPALLSLYGEDFTQQYEAYEKGDIPRRVISATALFKLICDAQRESGTPFLMYQDAINYKNNQQHLGVIRSSNLCTEITQFSSPQETAVCTLASIALPRFIRPDLTFDFDTLHELTKLVVRNTDALLDRAVYPTAEATHSAKRSRALGIGVQGFADCFHALAYVYGCDGARRFNIEVFETIYHAALEASCELAEKHGPYPTWKGSPASEGILQLDMWGGKHTGRYDFDALRSRICKFGLRNALLTAQMPTASTARVLGNSEGIDPLTSNVTTHRTIAGDYTEICTRLVRDLLDIGMWSDALREEIIAQHGSIASIPDIPPELKRVYRTSWEVHPSELITMAAERAPFIDQSQSLSLYIERPDEGTLRSHQLQAWRLGLKTGVYYLRTRAPSFPMAYGVRLVIEPQTGFSDEDDDMPPPLELAEPPQPTTVGTGEVGSPPAPIADVEQVPIIADDDASGSASAATPLLEVVTTATLPAMPCAACDA